MGYSYSRKHSFLAKLLEVVVFFVFWPVLVICRFRGNSNRRILLVEPFQMGDVLSLTPLIKPLLAEFPNSEIYVLTKASSGFVLDYDARIKKVIKVDFPWSDYGHKSLSLWRYFHALLTTAGLWRYRFDVGIDTRGDIRSQLLLVLAGCSWRLGYRSYMHSNVSVRGLLLTHQMEASRFRHRYLWNLELLTLLEIDERFLFPIQLPSFFPTLNDRSQVCPPNVTVIHIGGGWEYKRWPEFKWAGLINLLTGKGVQLMVICGPGEAEILERVREKVQVAQDLVSFKVTSATELISVLSHCRLFIGLDSGPMNLAVCLNIPVVALFGPGDSVMWRPINTDSRFVHKVDGFPCNPCKQTHCFFPDGNCMSEISVEDVWKVVSNYPAQPVS